ncbi:hypothetical protein MMC24_000041 [Lignoscripta atroalba]|nr:hypothetical protein [Lignoscripta atroalba]
MYPTISEAIGADHARLDQYYENLKNAPDLQSKIEWTNQLTWALARHAISEELTWYPAMEKHMGQEGVDMINLDRQQHQAVKEDLYKLQSMSPDDSQFNPLLERLMEDLHHHIDHEKNEDMPKLEKVLSREESKELAKSFERTKMFTPTRSHPSAPNKPYFENFAVMLAAPIDKFADLLRSFPEESKL